MNRESVELTESVMSKKCMNEYLILCLNSTNKSSCTCWDPIVEPKLAIRMRDELNPRLAMLKLPTGYPQIPHHPNQ